MTEQLRQETQPINEREILAMTPKQFETFKQRREFLRELAADSISNTEPAVSNFQPKEPIVRTSEGTYISRKRAGLGCATILAMGAIFGGGYLLGNIGEGNGTENPGATATQRTSEASGSPRPTATAETSNFQRKETREGWKAEEVELVDGTKIKADKKEVKVGETVELSKGAVISGDISMDDKFLSDSDALTGGLYINNKDGAKMKAPYNATAYENFDPSKTAALVETIKTQMEETGCGLPQGCETVIPMVYQADGTLTPYNEDVILTDSTKSTETQHPAGCQCQVCCVVCVLPSPSATPAPSEKPAAGCPEDTSDIEHNPNEWKQSGIPVEKHDGPAIFQADGTVTINGKTIKAYDSDDKSAQIYVVDDIVDGNPAKYEYDWIYGDLQTICPTLSKAQKDAVLKTDIEQTLARPDITSVKITYVNSDGTFRSEVIKE